MFSRNVTPPDAAFRLWTNEATGDAEQFNIGIATGWGLATGCPVMILHHPAHGGSTLRGASALEGGADFILTVNHKDKDPVRRLDITKQRDGAVKNAGAFKLERFSA